MRFEESGVYFALNSAPLNPIQALYWSINGFP
jgi:hypothetical protein